MRYFARGRRADGAMDDVPGSRNDGVLRSVPRLFMLVVSTATFVLGLIALVLETSLAYQQFTHELSPSNSSVWSARHTNVVAAVCATITYLVVSATSLPSPPLPLPPFSLPAEQSYFCRAGCERLISLVTLSFCSPTLCVRGERPCCGTMIGESLRSSRCSSSELLVSSPLGRGRALFLAVCFQLLQVRTSAFASPRSSIR